MSLEVLRVSWSGAWKIFSGLGGGWLIRQRVRLIALRSCIVGRERGDDRGEGGSCLGFTRAGCINS